MKTCTACHESKDPSEFYATKSKCKKCYNGERGRWSQNGRPPTIHRDGEPAKASADAANASKVVAAVGRWPTVDAFDAEDVTGAFDTSDVVEETAAQRKVREREEKAAAASARRRSSDFETLRPEDYDGFGDDDFATGIANDTTPQGKRLSAAAAAEKRQEFNADMGRFASDLHDATSAASRGEDLLDAMPERTAPFIVKTSEQERRFGNRRMARSLALYAAGEELSRRQFMHAADQYMTGRVVPTGYAAKGPSDRPIKRSTVLLLSDLHIGSDLDAASNPIPFRKVEEARRLEWIMRQAIEYKSQYRDQSELVVLFNGDLIEGLLMHDFRDGAPLTEQKIAFLRYTERMMGEFARAFRVVRVFCQPGNHGRDKMRHPGRATSSKWDGHETMLMYALARACSALPNVTFDLRFRAVSAIDLHGSYLGLSHGDTEVKVGDPDTKSTANAQILSEINSTGLYGVEFAAWAFGHYHKPRYQPRKIRQIFNGALVPPNGHARGAGYIGETCGQFLWEAVEGHPVGDVRFLEVGRTQDLDDRLGTIIEPFRFDLDHDLTIPS